MTGDTRAPEHRLAWLGLTLPEPPLPLAAFQPCVRSGPAVYVSGQAAVRDGQLVAGGRLGADAGIAAGQAAARVCVLNVPARLHATARLAERDHAPGQDPGIGHRTPDFTSQPKVADGASRTFPGVLGAAGAHARSAIGIDVAPPRHPVEAGAIAEFGS